MGTTTRKSIGRLAAVMMFLFIALALPMRADAANVAKIGGKNYKSLQAAMNAVKNGQTIKLLKNVTINSFWADDPAVLKNTKKRKYTINLNRHKIIARNKSGVGTPTAFVIKKGTVTIKNGTLRGLILVEKKGSLTLNGVKFSGKGIDVNTIQNSGTLRLKNVSGDLRVASLKGSNSTLERCTLTHTSNMLTGPGNLTIKSGTYTSNSKTNTPLIMMDGGGTLTINRGTFTSTNSWIVNTEKTKVLIRGGSFTAKNTDVMHLSGTSDKYAKVTISGGTFITNQKHALTTVNGTAVGLSDVNAVISGGNFISTTSISNVTDHIRTAGTVELSTGKLKITGGTITGNSLSPVLIWAGVKDGAFTRTGGTLKTNCPDNTLVADNRVTE